MELSKNFNTVPARLIIVEHQRLLLEALRSIIATDDQLEIVAEANELAIATLLAVEHDIFVIDGDPYGLNICQIVHALRKAGLSSRICMLSAFLDESVVLNALASGIDAYIVKDLAPAEILNAIHTVASVGFYIDPRLVRSVLKGSAPRTQRCTSDLTVRELEIVSLLAEGLTNKQIASELQLSEKTVKNHIGSIFVKLGLTARSQVAVHAVRHGLATGGRSPLVLTSVGSSGL